ncbi:MAG: glutathionylspermidine synthase family protein [Firmicutes bacterium]|nr:glutathionylspermidine synthase family protein [Bacillota bacterium]
MKQLRQEYLANIESDRVGAAKDMAVAKEYIKNSTATFTRGQLSMMAMPKMHTPRSFEVVQKALETTHSILSKIIERYLTDAELQAMFPFADKLKQLILLPKQYAQNLPICRLDIFLDEESLDFKFCEFNADGASAMNEDREIYNAWKNSQLYAKMGQTHQIRSFELFDSWVQSFADLYKEYLQTKKVKKNVGKPTIAIVDFLDIGTKSEFGVFAKAFEKAGYTCVIEDITTLRYDGKVLTNKDGCKIDAIYRRAVTSECMDKYDTIKPFLQAVRDDAVCLIGAFRTQVIHDKNLFRLLRDPYIKALLTKEENDFVEQHIPKTYKLEYGQYDKIAVLNHKDKWLIKPSDRYGSFDVHTGGDYTDMEWYEVIAKYEGKGFVLQEYCPPYRTQDLYFDDSDQPVVGNYGYMTGCFLYNGTLKGLYTRCMLRRTTTQKDEGRVTCSVVCTPKQAKN